MSLINVVPYVLGMTPGVPGTPEPRMYPQSRYFLVILYSDFPRPLIELDLRGQPLIEDLRYADLF